MVAAGFVSGAMADGAATTCGEFAQMSTADRLNCGRELLTWNGNPANHETAGGALISKYAQDAVQHNGDDNRMAVLQGDKGGWTDMQLVIESEARCITEDPNVLIVDRLRSNT